MSATSDESNLESSGRWARVTSALYSEGWAFFLPYLAIYRLAWLAGWTNGALRTVFLVLHALVLLSFLLHGIARLVRRRPSLSGVLFWLALALAFLLPGAYLEFPADPWEHLRRLNLLAAADPLRNNWYRDKFAFFWGWTFFSFIPPDGQRAAAAWYGAFWEMLLAYQFYRFARRIGEPTSWARLQTFGVLMVLGNGFFAFFRYYALSSTPLAYIAYLRGARAILDLDEGNGRRRSAAVLGASAWMAYDNHVQEVMLLLVFGACVLVWRTARLFARHRRLLMSGAVAVYLLALAAGRMVSAHPEAYGLYVGSFDPPHPYAFLSRWGICRIWDPALPFFQTIGLYGLVSLSIAVVGWRRYPLLATASLAPIVLLMFPPFPLLLAKFSSVFVTYRILFLIPDSFILVAWLRDSLSRWGPRRALVVASATLVLMGSVQRPPAYGKLRFQVYRPGGELTMSSLDLTAQWLDERERRCPLVSDAVTETVLGALIGYPPRAQKVTGWRRTDGDQFAEWRVSGPEELERLMLSGAYCGILIMPPAVAARLPMPASRYGPASGHWPPEAAHIPARMPPGLFEAAETLRRRGWSKSFVPPHYWLYEPPAGKGRTE